MHQRKRILLRTEAEVDADEQECQVDPQIRQRESKEPPSKPGILTGAKPDSDPNSNMSMPL